MWLTVGGGIVGVALALLVLRPPAPPPDTPSPGSRLLIDAPAPDFTVSTLNGQSLDLANLRGRPVFLNFWATWCIPCRAEMPAFVAFTAANPDGPIILAVNADAEAPEVIRAFLEEVGAADLTVGLDETRSVRDLYSVPALPTTYVIDAAGIVRTVRFGEVSVDDLNTFAAFLARETDLSEP